MYANGRFPDSALAAIPGGRLEREAAASWNAMHDYILKRSGVSIRPLGPNSSYRTYSKQVEYWNNYQRGGNVAARPGTSNHGWGKAVDVATQQMAALIRQHGPKFGWSWDEGRRAGEWWHFRYVGGYVAPKRDPFEGYPEDEKRWIKEYDKLVRLGRDKDRRRVLRRVMTERRKEIYRLAQKGGWNKRKRRARYRSLYARTK